MTRLTAKDVELLLEKDKLEKQLKTIKAKLGTKITALCDDLGDETEKTVTVAGHQVHIQKIQAQITEWKNVATHGMSEKKLANIAPMYSKERITRKVKVID